MYAGYMSCTQSWASIWNKIEKSCKNGEDKKSLIFTFGCFLTAIAIDLYISNEDSNF